jgi:hypothetical protein
VVDQVARGDVVLADGPTPGDYPQSLTVVGDAGTVQVAAVAGGATVERLLPVASVALDGGAVAADRVHAVGRALDVVQVDVDGRLCRGPSVVGARETAADDRRGRRSADAP